MWEAIDDQLPALPGGQVHVGGFAHSQDLIGGRVPAGVGPVGSALEGLGRLGGPTGLIVALDVGQDRRHQPHRVDAVGDVALVLLLPVLALRPGLVG